MGGGQGLEDHLVALLLPCPDPSVGATDFSKLAFAGGGQLDIAQGVINEVVPAEFQFFRDLMSCLVGVSFLLGTPWAGNDERGTRLIDKDAIGLVNNGKVQAAKQQAAGPVPASLQVFKEKVEAA